MPLLFFAHALLTASHSVCFPAASGISGLNALLFNRNCAIVELHTPQVEDRKVTLRGKIRSETAACFLQRARLVDASSMQTAEIELSFCEFGVFSQRQHDRFNSFTLPLTVRRHLVVGTLGSSGTIQRVSPYTTGQGARYDDGGPGFVVLEELNAPRNRLGVYLVLPTDKRSLSDEAKSNSLLALAESYIPTDLASIEWMTHLLAPMPFQYSNGSLGQARQAAGVLAVRSVGATSPQRARLLLTACALGWSEARAEATQVLVESDVANRAYWSQPECTEFLNRLDIFPFASGKNNSRDVTELQNPESRARTVGLAVAAISAPVKRFLLRNTAVSAWHPKVSLVRALLSSHPMVADYQRTILFCVSQWFSAPEKTPYSPSADLSALRNYWLAKLPAS